ncbi:uncharacterized protein ACNLHF_014993 isoform 2-T2 [Anomaloglossus baeobatrachus]
MNELKMLVEFGLERGSELVLSQLPGAAHNFRNEENSCSCKEAKRSWTAVRGLKDLQRRLELEKSSLTSYNEIESDLICNVHQYLLLFALKIKVKMECNFSAALLVVEPYWKQRFWDEKPVCLETCFEELAHIRLTRGQRIKQKFDKEQLGSKKLSVQEDNIFSLLKRQEDARDLLFHLLQSCSHEELQEPSSNLLNKPSEENMDLIKKVSETKVERNPLRQLFLLAMTVTKTCLLDNREMVTWGDCAERLLVKVQLKQELELRDLIQELSRGWNNDDQSGQQIKEPVLEGNDPVSYLIQLLQPMTPKEQFNLEQFKAELVSSLECVKLEEETDNKNITEAFNNRGMTVNISKQEENKNISVNDSNATFVDQQKKNVHLKRPEESSIKEKLQEKVHTRQKVMVSSVLKEHEKEQGHQCESCKKKRNLLIETPGWGSNKVATFKQSEECEQTENKPFEQDPSDELASQVMEATENLIAGLMILKAKVEEVYIKRGPDEHSPQRPTGSDTKATSHENFSSNIMEAAENLIVGLNALKEEIRHAPKSQLIEKSVQQIMEKDPKQQRPTEGSSRVDCENKSSSSSVRKNMETLEDNKKHDGSPGEQSDLIPCPMTREVSWELHPQCSQGCNHAKLWDSEVTKEHFSGRIMAGTDYPAVSENTSTEDKSESLNSGLKCLDEKPATLKLEPLDQKAQQAADTGDISHTSAEITQADCHQEDDQTFPLEDKVESGEDSSTAQEGRGETAVSMVDSSSEDGSTEQGSADKLAMTFLEAAHNLIGELIPGKEDAGLSSMRRVVVILTDSENGDLILGQGEESSEASGSISALEESSAEESQVVLLKGEEETDDHIRVPVSSSQRDSRELHADCLLSASHANLWEDCPEGKPTTMLTEVDIQPPIHDTEDVEQMTRHSHGCDSIRESQCKKKAEKENQINILTSEKLDSSDYFVTIKDETYQVPSKMGAVTEYTFLPTNKEIGDTDIPNIQAPMSNVDQKTKNEDKNKDVDEARSNPAHYADNGNITINVSTSERGNPLTQAGMDDTMMTDSEAKGAAEKQYKESRKEEETETGISTTGNVNKSKSVYSKPEAISDENFLCTGYDYMSNGDKSDETDDSIKPLRSQLSPYEGSSRTSVKSVLSTQDLIGSLTSLKDKLGKYEKIRSVISDKQQQSSEDRTNTQAEDPSTKCENLDPCPQQDTKEGPIIDESNIETVLQEQNPPLDFRNDSTMGDKTGFKEKESLSPSTCRNGGEEEKGEGMVLVNQGNRDWKQKWRSVCERQMDQLRRYDDGRKLESPISKRIKFQIIEKSKSDSHFYEQRRKAPSPITTVHPEIEVQEKGNQTSSKHEGMNIGEHMDGISKNDGDHVKENAGTEQPDATPACGNNVEQAPASLKMGAEQSNRSSDINRNGNRPIMDISTKTKNCHAMNDDVMNSHPIQETTVDENCGGGIERQNEKFKEKVESSEVVFSITSNLAIIQNDRNQGEHCHMQTDTQLEISTHSVETSYQTHNSEITQMQFKNQTQRFQEDMSPEEPLIKHEVIDAPLTPVSIISIDQTMPPEVVSNTSYCLKVSHTVTDDPLAKWKSIVMSKIKVSSQHHTSKLHNMRLDTAERPSVPSGNNDKDMNVDPVKQTDNQLNEEILLEPKRNEVEQIVDPKMKDLGEMQTLRSYIRNGVIKRKREDPEDTEDKTLTKENKKEPNEKYQEQQNRPKTTSDMYQGMRSELTHLHQLRQDPWLKFWEATNQTLAVAAVTTTQTSTFFGHMAQVPANGVLVRNEKQLLSPLRTFEDPQVKSSTLQSISETGLGTKKQECAVSSYIPQICSLPPGQAILQREKVFIRLSLKEQQDAMQRLRDLQRDAELKCTSDRRRQMLRFQERLSIARNRKSELDLMDITQRRSPQLTPEPLAEGDVERQKSAVKEHLEMVKRERTYIMQTRRDRNMTSFKELLDPVLTGKKREDSGSELSDVERL